MGCVFLSHFALHKQRKVGRLRRNPSKNYAIIRPIFSLPRKPMKQLFATTARGFEELLKVELTELGATECKIAQGGVHFQADDDTLYRSLLWSRLASRIFVIYCKWQGI